MNREPIIEDTTLVTKSVQRLKVETPLGSIESDSGNHTLDILTIVDIMLNDGFDSYNHCGDINSDGVLDIMDIINLVSIVLDN